MNSTVKLLTRRGREETRLLLERDQKRDQAKSKALEILPQNFVISRAQENQSGFFTRANTFSPSAESRKFGFMAHSRGTAETCHILIFD